MRALTKAALPLVVAVCALGCAETALVSLDLALPAQHSVLSRTGNPTELRFVIVQARPGALGLGDFEGIWGGFAETDSFALEAVPRNARWDLFVDSGDIESAMSVRVLLCGQADCDQGRGDIERWYVVERAAYLGRATEVRLPIETADPSDTQSREITRCEVRGCQDEAVSSYCQGDVGPHFCEL